MLNHIVLMGRLTRDPELRYTNSNVPVASFRIAVDRDFGRGENGEKQTPIVVHRAILGSLDRFFALLLEETKGILPLWLAPTQIVVIPVSPDAHHDYAEKVIAELKKHKIRVRMDDRNEKLGYRVREAQTQKIPVEVVVGDGEEKENSVTVRRYGSKEETKMSLDDFVKAMLAEIDSKGK